MTMTKLLMLFGRNNSAGQFTVLQPKILMSTLLRFTSMVPVSRASFSIAESMKDTVQRQSMNKKIRLQLATAYKALDYYGLNEGICNHLTAMAPSLQGSKNVMLVIPYGLHWSNVTPNKLIGVDENNKVVEGRGEPENTALCIHRGVYNERPDISCVMHTHMPYATALGCLEDPTLLMVHQNSARFHNRIAYDTSFDGIGNNFEEGKRLGMALGDKDVLVMGNHGILTVSHSVDIAFDLMYYFERAAMVQVLAHSTHKKLKELPLHVVEKTSNQMWSEMEERAQAHLDAMLRKIQFSEHDFCS